MAPVYDSSNLSQFGEALVLSESALYLTVKNVVKSPILPRIPSCREGFLQLARRKIDWEASLEVNLLRDTALGKLLPQIVILKVSLQLVDIFREQPVFVSSNKLDQGLSLLWGHTLLDAILSYGIQQGSRVFMIVSSCFASILAGSVLGMDFVLLFELLKGLQPDLHDGAKLLLTEYLVVLIERYHYLYVILRCQPLVSTVTGPIDLDGRNLDHLGVLFVPVHERVDLVITLRPREYWLSLPQPALIGRNNWGDSFRPRGRSIILVTCFWD